MDHPNDCDCDTCYEEWTRLNTCDVCDDILGDWGICERCAEKEMERD